MPNFNDFVAQEFKDNEGSVSIREAAIKFLEADGVHDPNLVNELVQEYAKSVGADTPPVANQRERFDSNAAV